MSDIEEQILRISRNDELRKEAREKLLRDLYRQEYLYKCQAGTAPAELQTAYNNAQLAKKSLPSQDTVTYGYWICVNPSDTVPLNKLIEAGKKAQTKIWIDSFCWVIEQRATTPDEAGKGFHYHCLITPVAGKKHNQVIRELANSFKHVVDTSNYHWFSVKPVVFEEYKRKLKYIAGYKSTEDKIIKQRIDVIYRKNMGIPKTYHSNDFDFHGCYEDVL